jgi:hypothetical protein
MHIRISRRAASATAATLALFGAAAAVHAAGIQVTVDERPVVFTGAPPMETNGSVLVPLRGVFEAIGASVNYDGPSRTIYASKGATSVILPIGSRIATVNGENRELSQPANEIGGTTLVPLRFVAESLGAVVNWHGDTRTVEILTAHAPVVTAPPPPSAPTVSAFSHDATGPLHAGQTLTATLQGTPGGQASFTVPGVADAVPMREVSPGVYTGRLTVPKNVSVIGGAVLGKLTAHGAASSLIQAGTEVTMDGTPPTLADISPVPGSTVDTNTPLIYATTSDGGGSGVNAAATRIALDGREVTAQATITSAFFNFRPVSPLAPGAHTVRVAVYDMAGNRTVADIPFTVSAKRAVRPLGGSAQTGGVAVAAGKPAPPKITSPANGAVVPAAITVRGTAVSGQVVHVKVDYASKALGGVLSLHGSVGTAEVTVDNRGQWAVNGLSMSTGSALASDHGATFTITATAVNPNGDASAPTVVQVRRN